LFGAELHYNDVEIKWRVYSNRAAVKNKEMKMIESDV